MQTLNREDIVGKRIKNIYHAEWNLDPDGCGYLPTYIELEDGILFELQSLISDGVEPIIKVDINSVDVHSTEDIGLKGCVGAIILEVLAPTYWPTLAIQTSNNLIISNTTFVRLGAWCMGPFASSIEVAQLPEDTVNYWQRDW
ncbi:hypothetical protein K2Y11_03640 [bacterium]|nr:hypothetical protein [bacterium]